MNLQLYDQVSTLFQYDLDPRILYELAKAEGPSRFRELSRRLPGVAYVDDGTYNASLIRLRKKRLIVRREVREGGAIVPIYEITKRGRSRLRLYEAIFDAYDTHRADPGDNDQSEQ